MWGKHVEHVVREAIKKGKNEKQRESKAAQAMKSLMSRADQDQDDKEENSPPPKGMFRDPMASMTKG